MKTSKIFIFMILVGIVLIMSSCATIIKGTSQDISISSNPSAATVLVKTTGGIEVFNGKTPASVKLPKKKEYVATISLEGYREINVQITQKFEAWALGNLVCGGVIGIVVDAVNGAMWKLDPDQIMVTLVTASIDGNNVQTYAVFRAIDDLGQLRTLSVPLVKDSFISQK